MTLFPKETICFSSRALAEHRLGRLAGEAIEAAAGAIVGRGAFDLARAALLANVAADSGRDLYLGGDAAAALTTLGDKGYAGFSLEPGAAAAAPARIALLYLREDDAGRALELLEALLPRLVPGGAVMVEGLAEETAGLAARLAALGVEAEVEASGDGALLGWVERPADPAEPVMEPASQATAEGPTAPAAAGEELVVLCVPNAPRGKFASMCAMAGYRTTTEITEPFDIAIKWFGETFTPAGEVLRELAAFRHVINVGCEDISKTRVEELHHELFGYGLMVEPTGFHGPAVMKANLNARCRESVVDCPLDGPAEPGFVYQRLIVTGPEPAEFEEYRVPITGGEIPLVVIKRRPLAQRFDRTAGYAELQTAQAVFSAEECGLLLEFCRRIGLDFGDLDVLRDRGDGRIYVIDANPTPGGPGGPGGGYSAGQRQQLLEIQLEALERYFFSILLRDGGRPAAVAGLTAASESRP